MKKCLLIVALALSWTLIYAQSSPILLSENLFGTTLDNPPTDFYAYNGSYYFSTYDKDLDEFSIYQLDTVSDYATIIFTEEIPSLYRVVLLGGIGENIFFLINTNNIGTVSTYAEIRRFSINSGTISQVLNLTTHFTLPIEKYSFNNSICFLAPDIAGEYGLLKIPTSLGNCENLSNELGVVHDIHLMGVPFVFNNRLIFSDYINYTTADLFSIDGFNDYEVIVDNVLHTPIKPTVVGNEIFYFVNNDYLSPYDELWKTDGVYGG